MMKKIKTSRQFNIKRNIAFAIAGIMTALGVVNFLPQNVMAVKDASSGNTVVLRVCNWEEYIDLGEWDE